jgi:ABC-type transporter Mla MlaB component
MKKVKKATAPRAVQTGRRPVRVRGKVPVTGKRASTPQLPCLTLEAECLVADTALLKANLTQLLPEAGPVALEIHKLQRIDTAALQVLAAFVRERDSHHRVVEWRGDSPALWSAAHLLGLSSYLKLQAPPASS